LEATDPLGLHAQACTTDNCSWDDPVGCTLDGMSIGCEMVQNWAEMAGGGGGGGGGGIVPCPGDCSGFRALEGPGGTTTYQEWQNATLVNSRITIGGVVTDATGTYTPGHWQTIGSSDSCGWDLDCQAFVGIVDLVLNEKPSGALRLGGARAVGVVVSRSAAALSAAAHWYCGPDPSSRILKSMGTGAALGAVTGGFAGFTAGELFGGELTLGLTGVPGAALGGFLGGTVGAMNGIAYGVGSAIACNAAGFYN
ncbi:MAG: hypothetical protein ACRD1L_11395, partial [Terriglobales bacterium]